MTIPLMLESLLLNTYGGSRICLHNLNPKQDLHICRSYSEELYYLFCTLKPNKAD
jgi:hypothetical protein